MNSAWVAEILNGSTHEEITAVLRQVGFSFRRPVTRDDNKAIATSQAREVDDYLRSPEGQKQIRIKKDEAVEREVEKWLTSAEGKEAVRNEIAVRVERWLMSPAGREALEIERKRGLQNKLAQISPEDKSWVDREVGGSGSQAEL